MIRRKALALALSMQTQCTAFDSIFAHDQRRAVSVVTSTRTDDDPTFTNTDNYKHLIQARPIQIIAKPIDLTDIHSIRKRSLSPNSKLVHFQRHGQGTHNELYKQWTESTGKPLDLSETDPSKNPLLSPHIIDAPLTQKGINQCIEQYESSAQYLCGVERIIVSPLVRALQTAQLTFRDHLESEDKTIPWNAHEGIREELGMLLCNKRRPLSETKIEFPHVDFTQLPGEEDIAWDEFANSFVQDAIRRESMEDMSHRAYDFLVTYLRCLPEKEVAVVGHSAWLHSMCNAVLSEVEGDLQDGERLDKSMFGQAEIRTLEVTFCEA